MKIKIAISPCPNDTFAFDAMIHNKIDVGGIDFDFHFLDIQQLNERAFEEEFDVSKLSFHAFLHLQDLYFLSQSGSALGNGNGPLFVTRNQTDIHSVNQHNVATPGKDTTAFLLFRMAYPEVKNFKHYVFNQIEEAILNQEVDSGIIIHENRFTFEEKGLKKIADLGVFWEKTTLLPIPLGCIGLSRRIGIHLLRKIEEIIRKSIQYAIENPDSSRKFIKQHAQNLQDEVIEKHIQTFVNEYTINLGEIGKKTVETLFQLALKNKLIEKIQPKLFIDF